MGYATFDDCLDNRYDIEPDCLRRMDASICTASDFLRAYSSDAELRSRVRATSQANIRWTLTGFAGHYYEHVARPVLERMIWRDGPEALVLTPLTLSTDSMDGEQYAHRMAARHGMVGPADLWEMKRRFQIEFLKGVGLLPHHQFLDLGCGTLRGGIPLIEYLDVGHYTGIDVRPAVLEEGQRELEEAGLVGRAPRLLCCTDLREFEAGQRFDVIWAFAVLIHLSDSVLDGALEAVARHLEPAGTFYATVNIGTWPEGSWQGFPIVSRTMEFYRQAVARHGLTLEDLGSLHSLGHVHPRLSEERQARQRMLAITHRT